MGYQTTAAKMNTIFADLSKDYLIYAPKRYVGDGTFVHIDTIRYGEITDLAEIEFAEKSNYSFKEVLLPISETLFYFTENEMKEADAPKKGAIVFLRSCDLHGLKRMDTIYLENGAVDTYYKRLRDNTKFILMGCENSFENCFCVSMGTQTSDDYDAYLKVTGETVLVNSHWDALDAALAGATPASVIPDSVTANETVVTIPETVPQTLFDDPFWEDYGNRCIACGRCNFVCPTCTCFTMQDIFYTDNGKAGERRRVWASCHIDGYTDMAGGHAFRNDKGQRMRFKVLHKVNDYKRRFGTHMCIGCGRCDDVCPEYISFANCINKLNTLVNDTAKEEN
ncbi:Anaerobic sulfite reductase subunit A [anaerobic digester metagenome]|uniref:anaerobic sulfite reductase subunit AsrA n=1 Tax=Acetobacterium wieringae TaxID=52694 RepID=UPI002033C37D|nr:anaerobic sulfite reductase subunit AsrA [Acetobacterium wieringae]URN82898.1 anaerobic sulfite reductase subunit AsrA [Acetobacterium wieringae]